MSRRFSAEHRTWAFKHIILLFFLPRSPSSLTAAIVPSLLQRAFLIPVIVACALFMENMDSTVITTSLPAIAVDIGENPLALKLALTSYLVSLAVFIPISGWVADRYGSRSVS